jgi:hypothetical protein
MAEVDGPARCQWAGDCGYVIMGLRMSSQSPSISLGQRTRPASEEATASDLQQLAGKVLSILRYRRWLFILPLLTGMLAVLVGSLLMPRQYVMRAVFDRRDDPVLLRLVANSPYNYDALRKSLRFSLIGVDAVSKALARMETGDATEASLAPDPARQAKAAKLTPCLAVYIIDTTPNFDLIELRYTGNQPELGEKLVTTLKDDYIRRTQGSIVGLQSQARKFFTEEVEKRRTKLARMQAEMTQLVIEQPEIDPARPDWMNQRLVAESLNIEQLNRLKVDLTSEIQAREEYLRKLDEQQKQGKAPSVFLNKTAVNPQKVYLEREMTSVMAEIADAKTVRHMKDTHPLVESLNTKLKQLRIQFERLPDELAENTTEQVAAVSPWDQERDRIQMELKGLRGKLTQLDQDLARHQNDRGRLETDKTTVFERQRDYMLRRQEVENLKSDLTVWENKLEEINRALAAENMDCGSRFNTVEECRRPSKPASPKLSGTFMLSGGVGLGLAVVAVFLRELFDRSFRNPARVRQVLGIPVLETIGEIRCGLSSRARIAWAATRGLTVVQVILILVFSCLNYVSLESPATFQRWTGAMSAKLTVFSAMVHG